VDARELLGTVEHFWRSAMLNAGRLTLSLGALRMTQPRRALTMSKLADESALRELSAAPGLLLWPEFAEDPDDLFSRSWDIADAVSTLASETPMALVSPDHNLPNRKEEYIPLKLTDLEDASRSLSCEHFANYGADHELTYFRGTRNLPSAVLPLVQKLEALDRVREEVFEGRARLGRRMDRPFEWRLTMNRYVARDGSLTRPGFPWHRDIEANGASTMILGLGTTGRLQFAEDPEGGDLRIARKLDGLRYNADYEPCVDLTLASGDLLALTGSSRWEMIHRVAAEGNGDARMSLVFGCW